MYIFTRSIWIFDWYYEIDFATAPICAKNQEVEQASGKKID